MTEHNEQAKPPRSSGQAANTTICPHCGAQISTYKLATHEILQCTKRSANKSTAETQSEAAQGKTGLLAEYEQEQEHEAWAKATYVRPTRIYQVARKPRYGIERLIPKWTMCDGCGEYVKEELNYTHVCPDRIYVRRASSLGVTGANLAITVDDMLCCIGDMTARQVAEGLSRWCGRTVDLSIAMSVLQSFINRRFIRTDTHNEYGSTTTLWSCMQKME